MFLQTCAPGAGCGGFSIARKSRERPDGFLNIYGQNKEEKTGDVLSPYQNIQPFKGFYVYLHGIGEIFNLHAFVRLAAAVARRTGLFLSPDARPKGDRIWQLPGVGAAVHGAGFCLCPQHLAAQGRKLPYHRAFRVNDTGRVIPVPVQNPPVCSGYRAHLPHQCFRVGRHRITDIKILYEPSPLCPGHASRQGKPAGQSTLKADAHTFPIIISKSLVREPEAGFFLLCQEGGSGQHTGQLHRRAVRALGKGGMRCFPGSLYNDMAVVLNRKILGDCEAVHIIPDRPAFTCREGLAYA